MEKGPAAFTFEKLHIKSMLNWVFTHGKKILNWFADAKVIKYGQAGWHRFLK